MRKKIKKYEETKWVKEFTDLVHKIADDSYNRKIINHFEVDKMLIPLFKNHFGVTEERYMELRNITSSSPTI